MAYEGLQQEFKVRESSAGIGGTIEGRRGNGRARITGKIEVSKRTEEDED